MEGYTPEQKEHLVALNRRMREVEEQVFHDTLMIKRRIQSGLDNGMEEYRTYCIDGEIIIEPDDNKVPVEVAHKFWKLPKYSAVSFSEGTDADEKYYNEWLDHTRHYDCRYWSAPEKFPQEYEPTTRAYDRLIYNNLLYGLISLSDVMQITPDDIYTHIEIHI